MNGSFDMSYSGKRKYWARRQNTSVYVFKSPVLVALVILITEAAEHFFFNKTHARKKQPIEQTKNG